MAEKVIFEGSDVRVTSGTVSYHIKNVNGEKLNIVKKLSGDVVEDSTVNINQSPPIFCDSHSVWKESCAYRVKYKNGVMSILSFSIDDNNILINNIGMSTDTNSDTSSIISNNPYRTQSIEDGSLDVTNSLDYQRAYRTILVYEESKLKDIQELLNRINYSIDAQRV